MPETQAAQYASFLLSASAALLLAVFILLLLALRRLRAQGLRAEALLRQQAEDLSQSAQRLAQDAWDRQADLSRYEQAALQTALRELERGEAARLDALGLRIDQASNAQDERNRHLSGVIGEALASNALKLERMGETLSTAFAELRAENSGKLEEVRRTVDEYLQGALGRRLGESFALVNERLEQVYLGLGEMKTLASGVGDLKRVLTNIRTRGIWGEMQLETLLSEVLTANQFERNAAVRPGSQERVEFALILPGRGEDHRVLLPIDAKFPIEAYERLLSALDAGEKQAADEARSALAAAVRREAARISSKYIAPPATTDFAVMYLPIEGLYAEALRIPGLAESLQRDSRVVVSGPTTLSALLNSLQMGFRTLAIEKRSGEVWQLLGAVKAEFVSFAAILDRTQARLRQASESIELASKKTRTIESRLRGVETLTGEPGPELPPAEGTDEEEGPADAHEA